MNLLEPIISDIGIGNPHLNTVGLFELSSIGGIGNQINFNETAWMQQQCANNPGACDDTLRSVCSNYDRRTLLQQKDSIMNQISNLSGQPQTQDITTQINSLEAQRQGIDNILGWCGCFFPSSQYDTFGGMVSETCSPECVMARVQRGINKGNGWVNDKCETSVCVIDDINIKLADASSAGQLNFSQVCPASESGGQTRCYISDVSLNAQKSQLGQINIKQNCGSCFTKDSNGYATQVPCDLQTSHKLPTPPPAPPASTTTPPSPISQPSKQPYWNGPPTFASIYETSGLMGILRISSQVEFMHTTLRTFLLIYFVFIIAITVGMMFLNKTSKMEAIIFLILGLSMVGFYIYIERNIPLNIIQ